MVDQFGVSSCQFRDPLKCALFIVVIRDRATFAGAIVSSLGSAVNFSCDGRIGQFSRFGLHWLSSFRGLAVVAAARRPRTTPTRPAHLIGAFVAAARFGGAA